MAIVAKIFKYGITALVSFITIKMIDHGICNFKAVAAALIITAVVIILDWMFADRLERYQTIDNGDTRAIITGNTNGGIVGSIYPQLGYTAVSTARNDVNQDFSNFMDIANIDKQAYQALVNNENRVKNILLDDYPKIASSLTNPLNTVPLGAQLYGYTYLPPENWFRAYDRPPLCLTENANGVTGTIDPIVGNMLQFDAVGNIMGPQGPSLRYVPRVKSVNK